MTRYLIDSNVLIEANNHYYSIEFCPAFWDWLRNYRREDIVANIDRVADEVVERKDAVSKWSIANSSFFLPSDDDIETSINTIGDWVGSQNYQSHAIREFLISTDLWLIAYALTHGYTLVTQEVASNAKKKVKIPNVCQAFGVPCINSYRMLRNENPRFVLQL